MARTPLMSRLLHLVGDVHEAEARGISVDRLRGERQRGVNRRDFLKTTGAAAVGLSVAGPVSLLRASASSQPRIGIMGAGIAGLNAALRLQDKGLASTVFESSDRIGGRMHSDSAGFWQNGQTSEWCGELIDSGFKTIMKLALRFDLPLVDMLAAQPQGSEDTYYVHGHYYPWAQAVQDFTPVSQALKSQLHQAPFPTLYNNSTAFGQYLDSISVYDWIEKYVAGGHASDFGELLDSAYNQEYGLDTPSQSSLNLVYLLGFQPAKQAAGAFAWYGTSDERYHILGGNQQLPVAIANHIQRSAPACTVHLSWRMTAIRVNSDRSITCSFSTPSGSQQQTFDEVILTMPFSVLRGVDYSGAAFDSLKRTAITQLGYGTNTKMNLQFNSRFWNGAGSWPGVSDGTIYTDLAFENSWEATRGQPGPTGIIVLYTAGSLGTQIALPEPYMRTGDSSRVIAYVRQYLHLLETVWPGATRQWNGRATVSTPWSDPNLLGSYACWKVGQYTLFSGYEGVRQGNIHFAGEHCSINFQGFMEGGAQEGIRAANEILVDSRIPV
jgi:monoamine oxidase